MKSKTKALLLAIFLLGTFAMGRMAMSSSDQHEKATPINVGIMSAKQKEHSKLYEQYKTGRKLDAIPLQEFKQGVEPGIHIEPGTPVVNPEAPRISFEDFIRNQACDAEAVVSVTIKDKASQLTENREFIFTDYTALVEEVHRNNEAAPIALNTMVTITRPGGRVEINNKIVSALDAAFKYLKVGKRYLLFLRYVPQTGAYQSMRQGSFLVDGETLVAMTEEPVPGGADDTRAFTYGVRNALYTPCNKQYDNKR